MVKLSLMVENIGKTCVLLNRTLMFYKKIVGQYILKGVGLN
jgi:hypothetical protein